MTNLWRFDQFCARSIRRKMRSQEKPHKILIYNILLSQAVREGNEPCGFPRLFSMLWTQLIGSEHRIFHRVIWVNLN